MAVQVRPAIDGWFVAEDGVVALLGAQCTTCTTVAFPATKVIVCPNPACDGVEFRRLEMGRRGRVWSYTTNHYAAPPPYVSPDPFVPYSVLAVELPDVDLTVLGQLADGASIDDIRVGSEVELTTKALYTDGDGVARLVWAWRPVADASVVPRAMTAEVSP